MIKKRKIVVVSISSLFLLLIVSGIFIFYPLIFVGRMPNTITDTTLIPNTAALHKISSTIETPFNEYTPSNTAFKPSIVPTKINAGLTNVDKQGIKLDFKTKELLARYGFALVDSDSDNIYDLYNDNQPNFITTDLCLHAYHVLYDISLRLLEYDYFANDFKSLLLTLRESQLNLNNSVSEQVIHDALQRNIAYLSVMLYLIDNTTDIPTAVKDITTQELNNIEGGTLALSTIFGYIEDFSQYKVRGHYTRNEVLAHYFQAMMYAGRMGFLLKDVNQTRMALLLLSSFNATVKDNINVWSLWDKIYEPTSFYVGTADDLTPNEYYLLWKELGYPKGDELANNSIVAQFIDKAKNYRDPKINSMDIFDDVSFENATKSFRLMGQRFIPDSYIFQQLVHNKVLSRAMPKGLDVFSVLGSPRAAYYLQEDNKTYPDYSSQVNKLRQEFANFTDYDWTQNLYMLWLYSLFPLLKPATNGYPGFMLSDAWSDKALMTASASWAELRHDTILYAKQSSTLKNAGPPIDLGLKGYVEPYPEVYSRLASLTRMMDKGLSDRGLIIEGFSTKLTQIAEIFDRLTTISIKELENNALSSNDLNYILEAGTNIANLATYDNKSEVVTQTDQIMAIIADVHTDFINNKVLEVGTGKPYIIYVVVQDSLGRLRLTVGGTFSYYEFEQPLTQRLTDEEWHDILKAGSPELPYWMSNLPIVNKSYLVLLAVNSKENKN